MMSQRFDAQRHPTTAGPPWIVTSHHRLWIDVEWLLIATSMLLSGLVFFGWRAVICVTSTALVTVVSAWITRWLIKKYRPAHACDSVTHAIWLGLLLGLCLPVFHQQWIYWIGGGLLGIVAHAVGRCHRLRVHPVVVVLVVIWVFPTWLHSAGVGGSWGAGLEPHQGVLGPDRLVLGDVFDVDSLRTTPNLLWRTAQNVPSPDALDTQDPSDAIVRYEPYAMLISQQQTILQLDERDAAEEALSRPELCRLSEILLGAVPGSIGASSRGLLIFLGLYLAYRRLSWWPMLLASLLAMCLSLLVMPVSYDGGWCFVSQRLIALGPFVAILYPAYMIFASPWALITMILAPASAPMSTPGRVIYGCVIGSGMILAQWSLAIPAAAFLALLAAGLISRPLDHLHRSPFACG